MFKKFSVGLIVFLCCVTVLFAGRTFSRGSSSSSRSFSRGTSSHSSSHSFSHGSSHSTPHVPHISHTPHSTPSSSSHSSWSHTSKPSTTTKTTTTRTTPTSTRSYSHSTVNHHHYSSSPSIPFFYVPWWSHPTHTNTTVVVDGRTGVSQPVVVQQEYQFSWVRTLMLVLIIGVITVAIIAVVRNH